HRHRAAARVRRRAAARRRKRHHHLRAALNMAGSAQPSPPNRFELAAEGLIFGHRSIVLIVFALITVAMAFFAAQLRVDAGFKKMIPLKHEYMRTFLDYEKEFGGANRILIAVMDKNGDMFNHPFFP